MSKGNWQHCPREIRKALAEFLMEDQGLFFSTEGFHRCLLNVGAVIVPPPFDYKVKGPNFYTYYQLGKHQFRVYLGSSKTFIYVEWWSPTNKIFNNKMQLNLGHYFKE